MSFGNSIDVKWSLLARSVTLGLTMALVSSAGNAIAADGFLFKGSPVHPTCVAALVTNVDGDPLPIPLAVSLAGCMASPRAEIPIQYDGEIVTIKDEALLGDATFSYRVMSHLANELFVLGVRWTNADGTQKVSLAVVDFEKQPMFRAGGVMQVPTLELLALVPIPDSQLKSFRRSGNLVQVKVGTGPNAMDRTVDLTPLINARKKH